MFTEMFLSSLLAILTAGILTAVPKWSSLRARIKSVLEKNRARKERRAVMRKRWSKKKRELLASWDLRTWNEFIKEYGQRIYVWCIWLTENDEALDLYHDVLLEVATSISRLRKPTRLDSFLYKIVKNLWMKTLREKRRRVKSLPSLWIEYKARAEISDPEAAAVVNEVWLLLPQLTPREQEVINLHYFEGLSEKEVAAKIGISVNAVRVHLHNALRKLRRLLLVSNDD